MSNSPFIEVVIPCGDDIKELLLAALDEAGYDSIMETENGLNAYIASRNFDEAWLDDLALRFGLDQNGIGWEVQEEKNWNEEWETNFEPVSVDNLCLIRAPFHKSGDGRFSHELIILPKMSFGTGHHATTWLMVRSQLLNINHKGKKVMDAGCGTAILAVMAEKLGAEEITAYDIDDWSRENAPENVEVNHCTRIKVMQGTIKTLNLNPDYDIILANINKNVLLEEMEDYCRHLLLDGRLLLSGFFMEDIEDIDMKAKKLGFEKINQEIKDRWACLLFKKVIL